MMQDIDQAVQTALNANTVPGYGTFFYAVTLLGSAYLWLIVLLIYMLAGRWKTIAAIMAITLVIGMVVNEDIKDIVQRIRPNGTWVGSYFSFNNYSFPSGHTETAFIMATMLSAFVAWRYGLLFYLLAVAVAVSRMYLGVHYFTDIIGGALTGIVIGVLSLLVMYRIGLIKGDRLVRPLGKALRIQQVTTRQDTGYLRLEFITLFFGLAVAMALVLAGQYVLSLATVFIVYFSSLTGAGTMEKSPEQ